MNPTKKSAKNANPFASEDEALKKKIDKAFPPIDVKLVCDNYEDSENKEICKNCGAKLEEHKAAAIKPLEAKPVESAVAPVAPVESTIEPAKIEDGQLILTPKHLELIKTQIAKKATPEEFDLFIMMARRTRLDPLLKQLYFMKYKDNRKSAEAGCHCYGECTCGKAVYSPATYVTSIDGYRIIAHRTNDFAGIDEPEYTRPNPNSLPTHCTVKVWRKSSSRPFSATVKFSEYTTGKQMWASMPETMIAKVAEAHALRKAFPQDLSGIYTTDEMDQADKATPIATDSKRQVAAKSSATPAAAPEQAPAKLMTAGQLVMIQAILKRKGHTVEKLKDFVFRAFKITTLKVMTYAQAEKTIDVLTKLPDPVAEPAPEFEPGDTVDVAETVFTPDPAPVQTNFIGGRPEEYVNVDDIPEDLGMGGN